jgi:hypothetical protein
MSEAIVIPDRGPKVRLHIDLSPETAAKLKRIQETIRHELGLAVSRTQALTAAINEFAKQLDDVGARPSA